MRYAKNFAAGYGLVWNPSEYVEGYTNFLWVIWMTVLHLFNLHESKIPLLVSLSGMIILILNILVVKSIAGKLSSGSFFITASSMIFTAFFYGLIFWTLRGMEVGLLTLLINYIILLIFKLQDNFTKSNLYKLAVSMISCTLLRVDSLLIIIFLLVYFYLTVNPENKIKIYLSLFASIFIAVSAHTLFRYIYYNDFLPNTYYLKLGDIPLSYRIERGIPVFRDIFSARLLPFILPVLIYIILCFKEIDKRRVFCLFGFFIFTSLYSVYIGGDSWEWMPYTNRYISISIPAVLILFSISVYNLYYKLYPGKKFIISTLIFLAYLTVIILFYLNSLPEYQIIPGKSWIDKTSVIVLSAAYIILLLYFLTVNMRNNKKGIFYKSAKILNPVIVILIVFCISNQYAFSVWFSKNAFYTDVDLNNTLLGVRISENTSEDAKIAVTVAGAVPYFSKRYSIDLLGKMDKYIAKSKPTDKFFLPGHSKWDHIYSITKYNPDLILDLFEKPEGELKKILVNDYDSLPGGRYIKKGTTKVNKNFLEKK